MNSERNKETQHPVEAEQRPVQAAGATEASHAGSKTRLVGVALGDGKVIEFESMDLALAVGDQVIVDNDRDLNLGRVVFISDNPEKKSLRKIVRTVGSEDMLLIRRNNRREEEALAFCNKRIAERELPMKLIRVAYLHGGNKAIFYFTADDRVDFRALVRDLAQQLHVRIEMRQIGVRDEAKMLGSMGVCGQQICCSRFLRKFVPVSIKMAKNQNLALNPQKLSGICGRLMCCLVYEDSCYRQLRKGLPKQGDVIDTPEGQGKVLEVDILGRKVRVQIEQRVAVFEVDKLNNLVEVVDDQDYPDDTYGLNGIGEAADLKQLLDEPPRMDQSKVKSQPDPGSRPISRDTNKRSSEKNNKPSTGRDGAAVSDQRKEKESGGENKQKKQRAKRRARRRSRNKRKMQSGDAQRTTNGSSQGPHAKK